MAGRHASEQPRSSAERGEDAELLEKRRLDSYRKPEYKTYESRLET
jgi:hypothetical protein